MKAVWRRAPITVRDVQASIQPSRKLAYTTVLTIMDRLYRKAVLTRTLQGRTHFYQPAIDYTEVRDEAVDTLIKSFFGSKEKLQEFLDGEAADFPYLNPGARHRHPRRLFEKSSRVANSS
jgi:predicted transcriptional regulator